MTTWTTCPECGCGRGEDHKRSCGRRVRPVAPNYHTRPVLEQIGGVRPDSVVKEMLPVQRDADE